MKSISKELFIMALLLMIVVIMIGMVFYKYMPNNKTVPDVITYVPDSSTTAVLQEISASNANNRNPTNSVDSEIQDVIKSYSIGTKELTTAASKQTYVSGKTDPFAEVPTTDGNTVDGNTTVPSSPNGTPAASNSGTGSSSTGTFFEKKGSK